VHVDVEIERPAKPLHHGDGAATRVHETVLTSPLSQVAAHLAEQHAHHGPAQIVVPRQEVPDPVRYTQHPLTYRHVWEHVIHQMRGPLGHPAPAAARAETAPFAGKSNQAIHAAAVAPKPGEPPGQPPTPEERLKLLLDEARQAVAVAQMGGLRPERLEVIADDLMQDAPAGIAPHVLGGERGHDGDRGGWRAKGRSGRFVRPSAPDDKRDGRFCVRRVRRSWQFVRTESCVGRRL